MSFRDIVGHRRLKRLLARAVHSGTLPPSLVFAGPEGVGKRQMAYALAQALNCLEPVDGAAGERDACGTCASCSRIARGLHPDVVLVRRPDDKTEIVIEQMRDVVGQTAYRPFEGRVRVVVIDDADELGDDSRRTRCSRRSKSRRRGTSSCWSPRGRTCCSTTVRSRCCVLRFAPLAAAEIAGALAGAHGFSDADAQAAAALSGGSFARAMGAGAGERAQARAVATAVLMETAQTTDVRARLAVSAALLKSAGRKSKDTSKKDAEKDKEGASALAPTASRWPCACVRWARCCETWRC